jgi:hypothetical protein
MSQEQEPRAKSLQEEPRDSGDRENRRMNSKRRDGGRRDGWGQIRMLLPRTQKKPCLKEKIQTNPNTRDRCRTVVCFVSFLTLTYRQYVNRDR